MIVSFRCRPDLRDRVEELIRKGHYPDFSSFCTVALENQLLLEDGETAGSFTPSGKNRDRVDSSSSGKRPRQAATSPAPDSSSSASEPNEVAEDHGSPVASANMPAQCRVEAMPKQPAFELRRQMPSVFSEQQPVPISRWLLGHYNRLLPAKVSARLLAVFSEEGKGKLVLNDVASRIAEIAADVGEFLRTLEARMEVHRDDALSIAFPQGGNDGAKGRLRYANHFVGHTVSGEQKGLLIGLKLATVEVRRNRPVILPTQAGWEFAALKNPVLDGDGAPEQSLSDEEVDYLLVHIRDHVQVELFAYRIVLSLIADGRNTPEQINTALRENSAIVRPDKDSDAYVSTQRGGVIGRLKDLRLVERERQGTSFQYHLTERGAAFLDTIGRLN